jgi:probable O-glycosylation ligase (exosortase A-associated)
MPEEWHERLGTIRTYEQDESAMGRINAWWFAWNVAKERPLVGGGFEAFHPETFKQYAPAPLDFHDAHSIYFEMLGEQGFVGLGLFLFLGWLTLRQCGWIVRNTRDRTELQWAHDLAGMVQVAVIGYAVGGAFLGLAYWDLPYHLVALTVMTGEIVRRTVADSEPGMLVDEVVGDRTGFVPGTRGS